MVFAIGGLVALGYGAQRYAKIVEESKQPQMSVEKTLDRFIEVRRGLRRLVDQWGDGPGDRRAMRSARGRGLLLHQIDAESYAATRVRYRNWLAGRLPAGDPVAIAFERRRADLAQADLGRYESLDF